MIIYGTAILSICLLVGLTAGRLLGMMLGVDADIGGVGIAMILLILGCGWLQKTGRMKPATEAGISFWGAIYVPIVVAMAASQNVLAALTGGMMALAAGLFGVVICFFLVRIFSQMDASRDRMKIDLQETEVQEGNS